MSQQQQICHLISHLDGYAATRQLRMLAQHQLAAGHEVTILALSARQEIQNAWASQGLRCVKLERRWQHDPFAVWRLVRELNRMQPDVLHAWEPEAARYAAVARRFAPAATCLATLSAPPVRASVLRKFQRLALPTEDLRSEYLASGVDSSTLAVVPPAVASVSASECSRSDILTALQLPQDARLIVTVGPLLRSKRLDEALWHFELVRTLNEDAAMLILGDGPDRCRLERYARLVSDPRAIKFLGYCSDIAAYLSLADVVWHTGEEPVISMAVLESMSGQVPVVASDVPINRWLIDSGKTGFLAAAGSRAMFARHTLRLLEDENLSERIGKAGSEFVADRFAVGQMIKSYDALYRSAQTRPVVES